MSTSALPYRPNVGIALFNKRGLLFIARRADLPGDVWQCPQGGIDDGEDPADAAIRELGEEIGTHAAKIIAEREGWLSYDLPGHLIGRALGGKYRGQTQKWFILTFTGSDAEIRLDAHLPAEFDAWEWVEPTELLTRNLGFKRNLYETLIPELSTLYHAAAKD